jgi:hypothetical protein
LYQFSPRMLANLTENNAIIFLSRNRHFLILGKNIFKMQSLTPPWSPSKNMSKN